MSFRSIQLRTVSVLCRGGNSKFYQLRKKTRGYAISVIDRNGAMLHTSRNVPKTWLKPQLFILPNVSPGEEPSPGILYLAGKKPAIATAGGLINATRTGARAFE